VKARQKEAVESEEFPGSLPQVPGRDPGINDGFLYPLHQQSGRERPPHDEAEIEDLRDIPERRRRYEFLQGEAIHIDYQETIKKHGSLVLLELRKAFEGAPLMPMAVHRVP